MADDELGEVDNYQKLFDKAHAELEAKEQAGEHGEEVAPDDAKGLPLHGLTSVSSDDFRSGSEPDEEEDTSDGADEGDESEAPDKEPKEDKKPAKKEPEPDEEDDESEEGEGDDEPEDPELAELKKLAEKKGFSLDDRQIAPQERVKFRQYKREQRAAIEREKQEASTQLEETAKRLEGKFSRALQMEQAIESGDMDKIAQLSGYKSYLDLNRSFAAKVNSPVYQEQQRMKRELERLENERRQERERMEKEASERQAAEKRQEYLDEVSEWASAAEDKAVNSLASDPDYIGAIVALQEEHYDPHERTTISIDEASKLALKSARAMYQKLAKVFGSSKEMPADGDPVEKPASGANAGKKKKGKKPKTISQRKTADASSSGGPMSDEEFFRMAEAELKQANAAD